MKDMQIFSWQYLISRYIWSLACVVACLSILGVGQYHFNMQGKIMKYLSIHSFGIYFIHMVVLLVIAYYILEYAGLNIWIEMITIIVCSFLGTLVLLEVFKKIPLIRWMFEIR